MNIHSKRKKNVGEKNITALILMIYKYTKNESVYYHININKQSLYLINQCIDWHTSIMWTFLQVLGLRCLKISQYLEKSAWKMYLSVNIEKTKDMHWAKMETIPKLCENDCFKFQYVKKMAYQGSKINTKMQEPGENFFEAPAPAPLLFNNLWLRLQLQICSGNFTFQFEI